MTYEEICANYAREFTKLSIWYARKRILEGLSDFENAITERTNIFRNTTLFVDNQHPATGAVVPEWDDLLERLKVVFDAHLHDEDTTALESKSLDILWPFLEEKTQGRKRFTPSLEARPYEAWTYDYYEQWINIHIGNTYSPESPLSEKRVQFAAALIRLLEDSQARQPDVTHVSCGSWLNSVPTFLDMFTDEWKQSAKGGRNVRFTMGHWGQFTDRTGDFHARNGAAFRKTGEFPYPSRSCTDRIDAALDHLRASFPESLEHNRKHHQR